MIDFKTFSEYCKYFHYAYDRDHTVIATCQKPEMKPKGESWGICDPIHCPAFNCQCLTADDIKHAEELLSREPVMTFKVAARTISDYTDLALIYGEDRVDAEFNKALCEAIHNTAERLRGRDDKP